MTNYIIHFRGIKNKNKINEIKHIYSKIYGNIRLYI